MSEQFNLERVLGYTRNKTLRFSEFMAAFIEKPEQYLHTSATLLSEAITSFDYTIVVRSGEPIISYDLFKDKLNNGTNAVYGQETAIKHLVDAIDSAGKETGPNRGLVLVGPPASGKTNIIDLITFGLEEYTKESRVKLYSFFFEFQQHEGQRKLELWSSSRHNPLLLLPPVLKGDPPLRPRLDLLEHVKQVHGKRLLVPTYYHTAVLDKCSIDIIEGLLQNPLNRGKSLYDIVEEYVRIEEIVFSNGQAKGISNIDDMRELRIQLKHFDLSLEDKAILDYHLPGYNPYQYDGAMVASNRGILHIHDGFSGDDNTTESDYRPLLMLLGSGKASVDATQASVDNTVMITTNLEEMERLEKRLTSSKLMDRIEKIPVNYLIDANSEMDILKRDMAILKENYEVDPNLLRIAAYYAVLTRLLPPSRGKFPPNWSERKRKLYNDISVEKKMFIYAYRSEDPITTIRKVPHWHRFRNEALKLGLDLTDADKLSQKIDRHPEALTLHACGLFTNEELALIDDSFMRELYREHFPVEGRSGISVRQLQNIMRNTIAHSDGRKVHVGTFLSQLKRMIAEGFELHHWLAVDPNQQIRGRTLPGRRIGRHRLETGEGNYSDYAGLVKVAKFLYYQTLEREITEATVDREPSQIEADLRSYLQYVLLANAHENKAFAHIMVPKFTFINPRTGEKVDQPDDTYMSSIEKVVAPYRDPTHYRKETAQKFLTLQGNREIVLEADKTVINSRDDKVLNCFHDMYSALLSHRRSVEGIDAEQLGDAFMNKKNDPERFKGYSPEIRDLVCTILDNMCNRFKYPSSIALDTVVYALRKKVIDFSKMIC